MNIYGFMIVKDEADIVGQTLESLQKYGNFTKIFVFDNGSSDDTLQVLQRFANDHIIVNPIHDAFSDNLKYENVYKHQSIFKNGDWFAILDADEVYQESLLPLVQAAEREQANYIESRSAQFYFTEAESNYDFDPVLPAVQQRSYYLLNYGEPRVFKYIQGTTLTADQVKKRGHPLVCCSQQLLMHHFQFRSSRQTQRRLDIRLANNAHSNNWGHITSANWKDYMVPARHLHRFDGTIKPGLPAGANLFKIRDNAAYTMANLNWLRRHKHLTDKQLQFFSATLFQRLLGKLWPSS